MSPNGQAMLYEGGAVSNQYPTVNAGTDQTLGSGVTTANLSGTASDSDGTVASSAWSMVSGPNTPTISQGGTVTARTASVTGMVNGNYVFRLSATDNAGATSIDDVLVAVGSTQTVPTAPSSLAAVAASASQINLSWTDNANNEQGFRVERAPDSGGNPGTFAQIATTGEGVTTYADTGRTASTKYHYRVRAYNAVGNSAYSNTSFATTPAGAADTTPPVVNVTSPAPGATVSGTIALAANATDAVGVVGVQFKVDGVNVGSEDTTAPYNASLDTLPLANGTHYVTAVARDAAGNLGTSAQVAITVNNTPAPSRPNPPSNLRATAVSASQVNLAWQDNS
jgi:hypothetical protein